MRHFLAYGNSDQVSFRDPEVRNSFDYMSVPGTIAAYYEDATAAFVLTSNLEYSIDPRTPLFQDDLPSPRASHFTLASWLGPSVSGHLQANAAGTTFPPSFYTSAVIDEMVATLLAKQSNYSGRAPVIAKKMDRYRKLLEKASGRSPGGAQPAVRGPSFKLAPYFAIKNVQSDPWWSVNSRILGACAARSDASEISPVMAVADVKALGPALDAVPSGLSRTQFFWVTDLDERKVNEATLRALWETVHDQASKNKRLINLYGGFFSICMQHADLWGFNNGLGYSESRAWPQLTSTGAAPPRYYIKKLHAFASPGRAELLINADPSFGCSCSACAGTTPVGMSYHHLKRHFALARQWERDLVNSRTVSQLAQDMTDALRDFRRAKSRLPASLGLRGGHLATWAAVLRSV